MEQNKPLNRSNLCWVKKWGLLLEPQRIKPCQHKGFPSFETSAQTSGKLAGAECQSMATYSAQMQPDGSLYGECLILELL